MSDTKICSICKVEKPLDGFYSNGKYKGKSKYKPYCKPCEMKKIREDTDNKLREAYGKELACERCGYNKNISALDFHHVDSSTKDMEVSLLARKRSVEKIRVEVQKCILLCSNCHREEHNPHLNKGP